MDQYLKVVIGKQVKRVGLQRYLASKIAFAPEQLESRDILCLFDNQLWLEKKSQSDLSFSIKFERSLEVLSMILRDLNIGQGLSTKALSRVSSRLKVSLPDFIFPKRNFTHMKSKFSGTYTLVRQLPDGIETKRLPPKAYIGKGYGDKGTASKPELDASHSWQDVATAVSNSERRLENSIEKVRGATTIEELKDGFWGAIEEQDKIRQATKRRRD